MPRPPLPAGAHPGGTPRLNRSYVGGFFLLALDTDKDQNWYLKNVHWGTIKGSVLSEGTGGDHVQFKHIGSFEWEPIQFEMGMAESVGVLDWITKSWKHEFVHMNGSIIHADNDTYARREQWFMRALLLEVTFPTLDASSTESLYLTVKLLPEDLKDSDGDLRQLSPVGTSIGDRTENQMKWNAQNFKLHIEGIDCKYVNKIESFSIKQKVKPLLYGSARMPEIVPTGIEFSEISLTLALEHAKDFLQWHQDVIKTKEGIDEYRIGYIEYLGPEPSIEEVLFTVHFDQIGIAALEIEKAEGNEMGIKRVKVRLFYEQIKFEYGTGMG